jgi:hypothetical protein
MQGLARRIQDVAIEEVQDRIDVAVAEWKLYKLCEEVWKLQRLLGENDMSGEVNHPAEAELRVWAPRSYDREINELEWSKTPSEVRATWQARVEALSFAALRQAQVDDEILRQAMIVSNLEERLKLGIERMSLLKALCVARLGFKDCDDWVES